MSSKNVLYEGKDTRLSYDVAMALRKIADGFASGTLQINDNLGSVSLAVGKEAKYEVEIKEKVKDGGVKRSMEVDLEWFEPSCGESAE